MAYLSNLDHSEAEIHQIVNNALCWHPLPFLCQRKQASTPLASSSAKETGCLMFLKTYSGKGEHVQALWLVAFASRCSMLQ